MSLFTSLQLANNAMRAQQVGIQVVGQNIANANTPGYIREDVLYSPAATQNVGRIQLGLGVEVLGVVQRTDRYLDERLRNAVSERKNAEAQQQAYAQLENIIGELSDTDLSTTLNGFFSAISEVLNQPESAAIRNLAVLKGQSLADDIKRLSERVATVRQDYDKLVAGSATDINRLIEDIRKLNIQIVAVEGGSGASDAVGLRDQRAVALNELAELINIRVTEDENGSANVSLGGDYLVFQGISRQVKVSQESVGGYVTSTIKLADSDSPIELGSGTVQGLISSRDEILGGFLGQLDDFARTFISEFNKVYSSGQGLSGYQELTSEFAVTDENAPLDAAGLAYAPQNGSFQLLIFNKQTGLTQTTDIRVELDGLGGNDTTFADLAAAIDAVDGVSASVSDTGRLVIESDSSQQDFAFAGDTSGALAALGVNTFFTGVSAQTMGVQQTLLKDPGKFAASRGGIGADTDQAVELAGFQDRPLSNAGGSTLSQLYSQITNQTIQNAAVAQSITQGLQTFEDALKGQKLAISGVSIDEELMKLISLQRAFQATARLVKTVDELLEILASL